MVCECAGCTEFGCNYFTVHRWNGDFDFKDWDITSSAAWRDYLTNNQPQKTTLLWRLRYDGEPYDNFMRAEFPRSELHQWAETWQIICGGPVRDNLLCSPTWGVRLAGRWDAVTNRTNMYFRQGHTPDQFYWQGVWGGVDGGLALPFALDIGCLRCARYGQPNSASSWPNPPGYWHDLDFDYAGFVPDHFTLPTEADVIAWLAAKQVADQAAYPGQYLPDPDVLPNTWRSRRRPTESNFDNSGLPVRLIDQAALWAGDELRQNPSVGCVPGIVVWSNRQGPHGSASAALQDTDSNYSNRVPTGEFSAAWWEGFAQVTGDCVQHTNYVTLSDQTRAIVLMGGRNVEGHDPLASPVNAKVEAYPADWATPIVNWLANGNKYLILDNPACNILPGGITAYPQVANLGLPGGGTAYWPIVYPSGTTGHAAAANAMLSALGSSIRFGELICMSRQGVEAGSPLSETGIDLAQVGSDPLRDGVPPQTLGPLGYGYENQRWGWKLSGGTPLVQATRRVATSFSDLVGYDEVWTCVAVERFPNGSVILVGGWEQSWEGLGPFTDGDMNSIIWSNLLAELPT
jgi:hypothetical protein